MAYKENEIGLLVKLNPRQAKLLIDEAYAKTNDEEPGRSDEKAAKYLGIGKSTIKRLIKQLADKGQAVVRPKEKERLAKAKRELKELAKARPTKRREKRAGARA